MIMRKIKYYFNFWGKFERFLAELIARKLLTALLLRRRVYPFCVVVVSVRLRCTNTAQRLGVPCLSLIHIKTPLTGYSWGSIQPKEWK
jgi:hypothetical protein